MYPNPRPSSGSFLTKETWHDRLVGTTPSILLQYAQPLLLAFPCFRCARHSRWCIELLGVFQGIPRELVSLLAEFVSGSMICLALCDRCDGVGVGCLIVKFCGPIV